MRGGQGEKEGSEGCSSEGGEEISREDTNMCSSFAIPCLKVTFVTDPLGALQFTTQECAVDITVSPFYQINKWVS